MQSEKHNSIHRNDSNPADIGIRRDNHNNYFSKAMNFIRSDAKRMVAIGAAALAIAAVPLTGCGGGNTSINNPPPVTYTLTESVSPASSGTVSGAGTYDKGQQVTISETPAAGNTFSGWVGTGSGSYTGSKSSATVTMDGNVTEEAIFLKLEAGTLYVATESPSSSTPSAYISVINIATDTVTGTIPLSANPVSNIIITPNKLTVYIGCADGNIDAINTANGTVTDIKIPAKPIVSLTITPNGGTLYAAAATPTQPNVFAISTAKGTITAQISVPDIPAYLAATPDGSGVVASGTFTNDDVYSINTSTNNVTDYVGVTYAPAGYISFGSTPSYGPTAYVSVLGGIDLVPLNGNGGGAPGLNAKFMPSQSVQGTNTPLYIGSAASATSTSGSLFIMTFPELNVIMESKIPIGAPPYPLVMTPNDKFVYVLDFTSSGTNLLEVNTSNQNSDIIPVTSVVTDSGQIVSTKDSNYLYVIANPVPATAPSKIYVMGINSAPHSLLKAVQLKGFAVTEALEQQ